MAVALLSLSSALALIWGCSSSDTHPPAAGDCVGSLCPPARSQPVTGSSTADGSAGDSGSGIIDSGAPPIDATIDDSGSDSAVDDSGNDGATDDSGSDADTDGAADSGGD